MWYVHTYFLKKIGLNNMCENLDIILKFKTLKNVFKIIFMLKVKWSVNLKVQNIDKDK